MRWIREPQPDDGTSRLFKRALILTLLGNISLALIKSAASYFSKSTAVYADAINSLSDVLYSFLLVIGLSLSQRPPDMSHPQGHSRFEPFAALLVTFSMGVAGVEALRASINRFLEGGSSITLDFAMVALLLSVFIKGLMFKLIHDIGDRLSSPSLNAAAKDNISDVITSLAALLGIIGSNTISPLTDPIAGALVAVWIFRSVWQTAKENLGYLTGAGADPELRQRIYDTVKNIQGVADVHHIITDYAGPKLVVEMHINADGNMTLNQAHAIVDQATEQLENMPEIDRAYIHVEPLGHT